MFYVHHSVIYFKIDPYFPRNKLVKIFKKYLQSFLLEEYSLNPHVREINRLHLEYNLTVFAQLNPDFGKKIWVRKRRSSQESTTYTFNDAIIENNDLIQDRFISVDRHLTTPSPSLSRLIQPLANRSPANNNHESNNDVDNNDVDDDNSDSDDDDGDDLDDDDEMNELETEEYEPEQPAILSTISSSYLLPDYSVNVDNTILDISNVYRSNTSIFTINPFPQNRE